MPSCKVNSWGPGISLSGPFLLVTLPASHLVQDVVPHPPRGLFASTPSIPEGTPLPFPAKPGPGSHWTPERTGVGETILAVQAARGVCWPVASHNRPRDTEGRLSGGPAVSFKPTLSPWPAACLFFPPSQAAVPAPSFVRKWDVDVHGPNWPFYGWETGPRKGGGGTGRGAICAGWQWRGWRVGTVREGRRRSGWGNAAVQRGSG